MFGSLKLGRFLGVDLFVHGTFWLLPAFVLLSGWSGGGLGGALTDVAFVFAVFACVVLHEYGHVLAARTFGIRTRDITLYPIGGAARLERMPEKPLQEIAVALAGPAVNVVIALGLGAALLAAGMFAGPTLMHDTESAFLFRLLGANVILVAFNLIPAFPMDGGRVLRAGLQLFTDRVSATNTAAVVGKVIAFGLFIFALYESQPFMMFLAVSVYMLGGQEAAAVRAVERQRRQVRMWDDAGYAGRDGWEFDAATRMWTEYRGGYAVRRFREA